MDSSCSDTSSDHEIDSIPQQLQTNYDPSGNFVLLRKLIWFLFLWQSFFYVTDSVFKILVRFVKYFLQLLGTSFHCPQIIQFGESIPCTTRVAEKQIGISEKGMFEFIVCPKCHSLYLYEDCVIKLPNGNLESPSIAHLSDILIILTQTNVNHVIRNF